MTADFRARGLIVNDRVEEYDGTTAVVRTEHLAADEIEFMRWRAERWMKLRHSGRCWCTARRSSCATAIRCLAHTFRGSSWRSLLGLETEHDVSSDIKQ